MNKRQSVSVGRFTNIPDARKILAMAEVDGLFRRLEERCAWHDSHCSFLRGQNYCSCDQELVSVRKQFIGILRKLEAGLPPFTCLDENIQPLFPQKLPHPGGRPTKYTPKLAVQIGLLQLMGGFYFSDTLRIVGVSRWSARRWCWRYPLFRELMELIARCRKAWPHSFRRPVLHPRKRRLFGTLPARKTCGRPTLYRPEFVQHAKAGYRPTAREIGVSASTVHRWSKKYYDEFGVEIDLARLEEAAAKLERTAALIGWKWPRTAPGRSSAGGGDPRRTS